LKILKLVIWGVLLIFSHIFTLLCKNINVSAEGKSGALIMDNKLIPIASFGTYQTLTKTGDVVRVRNIDAGDYDRIMLALNNNNIVICYQRS